MCPQPAALIGAEGRYTYRGMFTITCLHALRSALYVGRGMLYYVQSAFHLHGFWCKFLGPSMSSNLGAPHTLPL